MRRVNPYRCGYPCDHLIDPAHPIQVSTISYGGGVQSTALLVLAARGVIPFSTFLFCNVGHDSEHPATLAYVSDVAVPYAAANGLDLQTIQRRKRDGTSETLWGRLMAEESRSLPIPVRMANGAPGNRSCTADFKIRVIGRWLKHHGATADNPATVGVGISLDEIQRANTRTVEPHERVVYPLVSVGCDYGLTMRRADCAQLIRDAGLPVPPKSSCFFCPFHTGPAWSDIARDTPDLFARAQDLETTLNARRDRLGKDHVYLTRYGIPLSEAVDQGQLPLFDVSDANGQCDSGYCFT